MRNFFISHALEDSDFTKQLTQKFEASDFEYWIKPEIRSGMAYYDQHDAMLENATDLVIVFSSHSAQSNEIFQELQSAIFDRKHISIVLLEDIDPPEAWRKLLQGTDVLVIRVDEIYDANIFLSEVHTGAIPRMEDRASEEALTPETIDDLPLVPDMLDTPHYRTLRDHREAIPKNSGDEKVQFTTYHPKEIKPGKWYKLLSYAHLPGALEAVKADSRSILGEAIKDYGKGRGVATETILREAEITVVPELPGCRFNPPRQTILWLEDWHRAEFRLQANPDDPEFEAESAVNGRVAFYVGPILVAETKIWAFISEDADEDQIEQPEEIAAADPYRDIFISYSHKDTAIVEQVEKALATLGDKLLRDAHDLRSGEDWNAALLDMIDRANIFQLFWSNNSKASIYVEQEWRRALARNRPNFIRPIFWEDPIPKPPDELRHIHFERYEL